jgi:hypothetical protein
VAVRMVERVRHLRRDAQRVRYRELSLALEARAQRFPRDEGHDVIQLPVGNAAVEERQDVRVLKSRGELDLLEETLRP